MTFIEENFTRKPKTTSETHRGVQHCYRKPKYGHKNVAFNFVYIFWRLPVLCLVLKDRKDVQVVGLPISGGCVVFNTMAARRNFLNAFSQDLFLASGPDHTPKYRAHVCYNELGCSRDPFR